MRHLQRFYYSLKLKELVFNMLTCSPKSSHWKRVTVEIVTAESKVQVCLEVVVYVRA